MCVVIEHNNMWLKPQWPYGYDSEDGELWGSNGSGSDDSWETQSSADAGRAAARAYHAAAG